MIARLKAANYQESAAGFILSTRYKIKDHLLS
jgi:hypothetical protein